MGPYKYGIGGKLAFFSVIRYRPVRSAAAPDLIPPPHLK